MPLSDDAPPWFYLVPWSGECVDNADPLRLGRVKVSLPGICDDPSTGWALPLGFGGVHYDVPATKANYAAMTPAQDRPGDECIVWFLGGDPDQPRYLRAHGGMPDGVTPEVPDPVKTMAITDAHKIKSHQFGTWVITVDDRAATRGMTVKDTRTGEVFLEYDGATMGMRIKTVGGLSLESDGALNLLALMMEIMRRRVMISADSI